MKQAASVQPHHRSPAPASRRLAVPGIVLAGLLIVSAPEHLEACNFHVSLSGNTVSGQVAESVELVAMRPSLKNPFQFEAVEQLKGTRSHSTPPHLVDSTTRRRLAQNPDHAVLFARGSNGIWTRLMFLDEGRRNIARQVLANSSDWATSSGASNKRDYFAALLNHPNRDIVSVALREIDAMDYAVLRGGTYPVTAQDLLSDISDVRSLAFAPVRILLLGIVGGRDADLAIARRLQGLVALGSAFNLGAWITAAIETGGRDGIGDLERQLLDSGHTLSRQQLFGIIGALSVHSASNGAELRTALDDALRRLVGRYPEAAPMVAQAFATASDWSQVSLMRELIAADMFATRADLMATAAYLSRASDPETPRRHPMLRTGLPVMSQSPRP